MSKDPALASHPAAAALARAGWEPLQERLIAGFCHDLNGRLAALHGLIFLVEAGEPIPPGYTQEIERLEDVSGRMVQLTGDIEAAPTPLAPAELIERALRLYSGIKDLDGGSLDPSVTGDLPALLINERFCIRLLLLFADAAWRATKGPERTLEVSGDRDGIRVAFAMDGEPFTDDRIAALSDAAGLEGGRVRIDGVRCVLELPSLSRSRAEGR